MLNMLLESREWTVLLRWSLSVLTSAASVYPLFICGGGFVTWLMM